MLNENGFLDTFRGHNIRPNNKMAYKIRLGFEVRYEDIDSKKEIKLVSKGM